MAAVVTSRGLTIQGGLKRNTKDFKDFGWFVQGIDDTQQNLDQFDPYIQGISRIFLYTPPYFMQKEYPAETIRFKHYIETGYNKIDGIQDTTAEFVTFEGGFNGQKFEVVSKVNNETNRLTISVYELSGSPIREYTDTWMNGTRDNRSGVAHYHGGIQNGGIKYSEKYHTAEHIYYSLDPTAMDIEYACMFAHNFPTKVPKGHLNYEKGNRDNVLLDLEYTTSHFESTYINQVANYYMAVDRMHFNYLDFNPNISQENVKNNYSLNLLAS